jgi:DNA polymerase
MSVTSDERQVGKAATLGCGFGLGDREFQTSAWDVYRAKVSREVAKLAVSTYREVHWPVVELWESYQESAIWAVENPGRSIKAGRVSFIKDGRFLKIKLPSGRFLSYCDPKVEQAKTIILEKEIKGEIERAYASTPIMLKKFLDEGYKKTNEFYSKRLCYFEINQKARKEDCVIPKWTIERTYGGKICENVVQAVSRDILAETIVNAEKAGFYILMHSHDEPISEAPKGKFKLEDFLKIMETLPAWAEGLPIKAGGWTGPRYKKG